MDKTILREKIDLLGKAFDYSKDEEKVLRFKSTSR